MHHELFMTADFSLAEANNAHNVKNTALSIAHMTYAVCTNPPSHPGFSTLTRSNDSREMAPIGPLLRSVAHKCLPQGVCAISIPRKRVNR